MSRAEPQSREKEKGYSVFSVRIVGRSGARGSRFSWGSAKCSSGFTRRVHVWTPDTRNVLLRGCSETTGVSGPKEVAFSRGLTARVMFYNDAGRWGLNPRLAGRISPLN